MEKNEASATACLKILAVSEADFRSNDRDANLINDFWTADVAGLHSLLAPSGAAGPSYQIQLVERALADADGANPGARPYRGYFFRAMETDDEGNPYRQDTERLLDPKPGRDLTPRRNNATFGFCAYPADYGRSGRWTFIISEGNVVFKHDTEGRPVLRFPSDSGIIRDLRAWDRLDE